MPRIRGPDTSVGVLPLNRESHCVVQEDGRISDRAARIVLAIMTLVEVPVEGPRPKAAGFILVFGQASAYSERLTGHGSQLPSLGRCVAILGDGNLPVWNRQQLLDEQLEALFF